MLTRFFRLLRINYILMQYNIDSILLGHHRLAFLAFIKYLNPFYWTRDKALSRGARIRLALQKLGPIYVKVGQMISTRRDLIPDDIADELTKLQDRVAPFPGLVAKKIIENSLKCDLKTVFAEFDLTPLASASISQVHAATLLTGEKVVIKVLRPNIKAQIARDTDLLLSLAKWAGRYWYALRRFKPQEMVQEITQTLNDELDLLREGANASQLSRNFAKQAILSVPKIYWSYCKDNILVMERIYGIPIYDTASLQKAGVDFNQLAERSLDVFFTQVFRDNFFHADLHPGNIFVDATHPDHPTFIAVDFGIMGTLSRSDQRYLAENMMAFFKRDYQRVAELHIACGWLPPNTRVDQFESAIRAVSEPIFEQSPHAISFGQLLLRLFQVARRFHINIQPQLILLQKTLVNIEGLCKQLAPEFNLWGVAAPQIEKWLKQQVGVRAFLHRLAENLPQWSQQLPAIPNLIYEVLQEVKQQKEAARFKSGKS